MRTHDNAAKAGITVLSDRLVSSRLGGTVAVIIRDCLCITFHDGHTAYGIDWNIKV